MFSSHRLGKRRWTLGLTLLASVIALGLGVTLRQSMSASAVASAAQQALDCREWASAGRLAAIALLFAGWPTLIRLRARSNLRMLVSMQGRRWRVTAWLLAFELIIGQNLLGRLLG